MPLFFVLVFFFVKDLVVSEIIYNFTAGYRNQLKTAKATSRVPNDPDE